MEDKIILRFRRFREGAIIPQYQTSGAAGFDLHAWIGKDEDWSSPTFGEEKVLLSPNQMIRVKTGLNVRVPEGYELQIRPRSGLAAKFGITIINSPGTIDSDYDGDGEDFELAVLLRNEGHTVFTISNGDRIAQGVLNQLPKVEIVEDFELNRRTGDRVGGFGSSG